MVSYEKASKDLLRYLTVSQQVVVLDPTKFKVLMLLLKAPITHTRLTFPAYDVIDITTILPNILDIINNSHNHWESGLTYLIDEYAQSWIPIGSPDYTALLDKTFLEHQDMVSWQRGIRASITIDRIELTHLSLDPDHCVRELAQKRFRELEQ